MTEPELMSRGAIVRLIALGAFALICAAGVLVCGWLSSEWQNDVNRYFQQANGNLVDTDPGYLGIQRLSQVSFVVSNAIGPLTIAAILAVFAIVAIFAVRWARENPFRP